MMVQENTTACSLAQIDPTNYLGQWDGVCFQLYSLNVEKGLISGWSQCNDSFYIPFHSIPFNSTLVTDLELAVEQKP